MKQLKAGYFTSGINSLRTNDSTSAKVDALIRQLCYFELDSSFDLAPDSADPAIAVIYNIVSRGTPTYASQFIEGILSTTIGKTLKRIDGDGTIYHEIQKDEVKEAVFKALHIVDPRITDSIPLHGENKEVLLNDFVYNVAKPLCGNYITQIAEKNAPIENLFKFNPKNHRLIETLKSDPSYSFPGLLIALSFFFFFTPHPTSDLFYTLANVVVVLDYKSEPTLYCPLSTTSLKPFVDSPRSQDELQSSTHCLQDSALPLQAGNAPPYLSASTSNVISPSPCLCT